MNLINRGDFLEFITKFRQKGFGFFLSKLTPDDRKRTQSTFNTSTLEGSNWWIIPEVKQRENKKISGDPQKTFDKYLSENYFKNKSNLKLMSVACGTGNREIRLAESGHFGQVIGIDLSPNLVREANEKVTKKGLKNIRFEQADFYTFQLQENFYDVILFHMALHHFKSIDKIADRISLALKSDGLLVLNEYVGKNRLQFTKGQLAEMNRLLMTISKPYRKRYLTNVSKKRAYAPGLLRMIISDPSESVESETIRPIIHQKFKVVEEKSIGGDLLMMVLKDIAHHFTNEKDEESKQILATLFKEEDQYLEKVKNTDFIFGVYQNANF